MREIQEPKRVQSVQWVSRKRQGREAESHPFTVEGAKKAREFHRSFPEYEPTPLTELKAFASAVGVEGIFVKDESFRFGQNSFKVLGGSFAVGNDIARRLGLAIEDLNYERLVSREIRERLGDLTFVTATDGNHGRGVAWTAGRLGQGCVVYLPAGSSLERLEHIRAWGAKAEITAFNYDDTVRLAAEHAKKYGWALLQDTAWEGYEEVPVWIMQGYTTLMEETVEQLEGRIPTHVFLQAGVGAMAGAATGYLASRFGEKRPVITIVEPSQADCLFRTARADDGNLHRVEGSLSTIMAGLACGEPCTVAWKVLRQYADFFVSMPDWIAAQGMRILGNPMGRDARIVSGESGAAAFGLAACLLREKELEPLRRELGIDQSSVILCISTEGDTDRGNYRRIVWDGAFSLGG